eukprot:g3403.t1
MSSTEFQAKSTAGDTTTEGVPIRTAADAAPGPGAPATDGEKESSSSAGKTDTKDYTESTEKQKAAAAQENTGYYYAPYGYVMSPNGLIPMSPQQAAFFSQQPHVLPGHGTLDQGQQAAQQQAAQMAMQMHMFHQQQQQQAAMMHNQASHASSVVTTHVPPHPPMYGYTNAPQHHHYYHDMRPHRHYYPRPRYHGGGQRKGHNGRSGGGSHQGWKGPGRGPSAGRRKGGTRGSHQKHEKSEKGRKNTLANGTDSEDTASRDDGDSRQSKVARLKHKRMSQKKAFHNGLHRNKDGVFIHPNHKTVMCTNLLQQGFCRFGDACAFAHNPSELRPRKHTQRKGGSKGSSKGGNKGGNKDGNKDRNETVVSDMSRICIKVNASSSNDVVNVKADDDVNFPSLSVHGAPPITPVQRLAVAKSEAEAANETDSPPQNGE